MKNKILVIEDDRAISELLCMNLEAAGYETVAAYDGEEAQRLLLWQEDADLAVVDIMLPGKDGFALMEDFKKKELPVLYLTAKDDVASKVKGLKLGAEDYMVKPFEMLELLVRIEKVLERTGRAKKVLTVRNILVDMQSHQVYKDGLPVSLKPMEYDLFVLLLQNKNIALGREELLKRVWGENYLGESRTVDVHIGQLRKKLELMMRSGRSRNWIPSGGIRMKLWKRTVLLMLVTLLCALIPVGTLSLYITGKRSLNNAAETYGRQLENGKILLEQFWG